MKIHSALSRGKKILGRLTPPPDKSLTHRALIFAALSSGKSVIDNPLLGEDCLSTARCLKALGVPIQIKKNQIVIDAGEKSPVHGFRLWKKPSVALDCGNSGTTLRILSGLLAAQPFTTTLVGDPSLSRRPMRRVMDPLAAMGAQLSARQNQFAPLTIVGNPHLRGVHWKNPVASAQVKSAVLLAGLFAQGETIFEEPTKSRDHTERLLKSFGAKIKFKTTGPVVEKNRVSISASRAWPGFHMRVPGDFSSAAFLMAAALLLPGSRLILQNVNLNPTRSGLLEVFKRMGGRIKTLKKKNVFGEVLAELEVCASALRSTQVGRAEMASLVDEIPILAVCATQASGTTTISGAEELRVKETDRLSALARELKRMGARISEKRDGLVIRGPMPLGATAVETYEDHRMAMSLSVAGLVAQGTTLVEPFSCVAVSYPQFLTDLRRVLK